MEQKHCLFRGQNEVFKGEFHPLHLRSDKVKWISAFGRCDSPCIASLCSERDAYHSNKNKFFVVVHLDHHPDLQQEENPVTIVIEDSKFDDQIVLLASDEFYHHYGIVDNCGSLVVGLVSVFPLSRVILSAQTNETFQWANSLGFERGLMVTGTSQKSLLVRQGDQFLAPPRRIYGDDVAETLHHFQNLIALECYPIKQGYIHANTEVIITDGQKENTVMPLSSLDMDGAVKVELATAEILKNHLIINGQFDLQNDALGSPELAEKLSLKDGEIIKLLIRPNNCSGDQDHDSVVFADDEIALEEHEEEYFSMETSQQTAIESQRLQEITMLCYFRVGHLKQSKVFSNGSCKIKQDTIYLSNLTWFNACSGRQLPEVTECADVEIEKVEENQVPYAKEIHLSLVLSPDYSPSAQFDQTLMKHLLQTRILKKNDVISISTEGNVEFLGECDAKDASCKLLHYKVMKFGEENDKSDSSHFRVNLKRTSLYQVGTTNSFIPRSILASNLSEPAGLNSYIEEMKKIFSHLIKGELDTSGATILLSGAPGCGKQTVVSSIACILNLNLLHINCHELLSDSSGATEAKINTAIQRATVYAPCMVVLSGIDCIGKDTETGQTDYRVCTALQNAIEGLCSEEHPIAVAAMASNSMAVASKIRSLFLHQIEIKPMPEIDRLRTLLQLVTSIPSGSDIDVHWIAKHTVGFIYEELWALVKHAVANARERVSAECAVGSTLTWMDEINICSAGIATQHCDFVQALQKMQSQRADVIGVPKIPDVKWDDIGGLDDVKSTIKDTIQLPLEHPELVSAGLRRSGILLYGPPGTGKTLLAKAVATQCSLSFLSVKGPELINMYVGQSEENVRKVFSRARGAAPCVVFFDELDSLAPNRGRSGDSGGVMDRVVSQLLAELDGLVEADAEKQIFVIGASNRPDLIDPALLRPGRFDKLLYVSVNTNKIDQLKILEAQTRRANLSTDVRLDKVIELCPERMTGADFYALTSEAMMNAIRRRIEAVEARQGNPDEPEARSPLVVEQEDFVKAAKNIVPSVTEKELSRFQEIRTQLTSR